jgi:hypothetical protein
MAHIRRGEDVAGLAGKDMVAKKARRPEAQIQPCGEPIARGVDEVAEGSLQATGRENARGPGASRTRFAG